jgi:tetratricopeptide (TPR) repeat protein
MPEGERKEAGFRGEPAAPRSAGTGAGKPRSRWRDLLMASVAIGIFFFLLEAALALLGVQPVTLREDPFVGFAGRAPLFVPQTDAAGESYLVTSPAKLELFNEQRFPARKRPRTYRIFCLGGSTTFGRPYDDATSFAGWLRELLPVVDPGRRWEVINAGGVSYASYRVARVMRGLADLEPDLFVVYTGQNEFLEERTYPAMRQLPAPVKTVAAALSGTRTWAAMDALMTRIGVISAGPTEEREVLTGEVDAKLDRAAGLELYERDDELRDRILDHYRLSLERMVAIARAAEAELVFVVPAANLRSCSPFKSQHTSGLEPAQVVRSEGLLEAARRQMRALAWPQALASIDEAIGFDPRCAALHYERGRALFALGRHAEAKAAFERARDEDVCPLRALGEMEQILRRVAAEAEVPLVDFRGLLEANLQATAGHTILGEEDFLDHVHPTIAGHGALAVELLEAMRQLGALARSAELDEERLREVTARVEGGVDREEQARALAALARTLDWAGKEEESRRLAFRALESGVEHPAIFLMAAKHRALEGDHDRALDLYLRAVRADPLSPTTHYQTGLFSIERGDLEAAAAHLLLASVLWPEDAAAHEKLGLVMAERGRYGLALASLEEARRRSPGRQEIVGMMARVRQVAGSALAGVEPPEIIVERYPSGTARRVAQAGRDAVGRRVLNGLLTEWSPSGTLRRVVGYVDGVPRADEVIWDETGARVD